MISHYIYAYLIALAVMSMFDAVWLILLSPAFYKKHIGFIMAKKPNLVAAVAFYLIFGVGITVFIIYPSWQGHYAYLVDILKGALFGLVSYSTYDLSNQAIVKNWPPIVTIVDLVWGTVLSAAVSIASIGILNVLVK